MINKIILPSNSIRNYVKNFWVAECDFGATERILKLYAGRYPRLTIQCTDNIPNLRYYKNDYLPNSYLTGIKTGPVKLTMSGRYSHFMVIFYPQAIKPIFKVEPWEIVDGYVDLLNFCPEILVEMICEAADVSQKIEIMTGYIASRIPGKTIEDPVIQDFVLGKHDFAIWNLSEFLRHHKISERQLERKFKSWIGVPPKTYLRIARFEKALLQLQLIQREKLSSVAYDLGYADHPHFSRDFRNAAGFSPRDYVEAKKIVEHGNSFLEG